MGAGINIAGMESGSIESVGDHPDPAGVPASPESKPEPAAPAPEVPVEVGGRDGPEPTRFGDWEKNGRCIDF
jgi:hypothetical protein